MKKALQAILLFVLIGMMVVCSTGCSLFAPTNNTEISPTTTPNPDATIPPQQNVDAEYKLYDKHSDFSIQYHEQWKIKENSADEALVVFTVPEGMGKTEEYVSVVYPTMNVFQFEIAEKENFKLKNYVKEQLEYLEKKIYQFTLLKEEPETVEIGGTTAYMIQYTGTVLNADEIRTKQMFIEDGESIFIVTYSANTEYYNNENYMEIANKMMQSFAFK